LSARCCFIAHQVEDWAWVMFAAVVVLCYKVLCLGGGEGLGWPVCFSKVFLSVYRKVVFLSGGVAIDWL